MAIKIKLGKLILGMAYQDLQQQVLLNGFEILPISFEHTIELSKLDLNHRDPFDRIIIAQALTEKLIIISRDANFSKYDKLQVIW